MHPKKLASVTALDGPARYEYFIRRIADAEEVWGLFDAGWATAANDGGGKALPFWPEAMFAQACATGAWASHRPTKLTIADLLEKWIANMKADGFLVAVFPTPQNKGVFVHPSQLAVDLEAELEQYE